MKPRGRCPGRLAAGSLVVGLLLGAYVHVMLRPGSGTKMGMNPSTT
jgi:hypothetical protein